MLIASICTIDSRLLPLAALLSKSCSVTVFMAANYMELSRSIQVIAISVSFRGNAQAMEPRTNNVNPLTYTQRAPKLSAIQPQAGISMVMVSE